MTDAHPPHDDTTGPDTQAERRDDQTQSQDSQAKGGVGLPPGTGDAGVDRVLQELRERLQDGPGEHVAAVTEAHRQLQARLSTPTPPAPPGQALPGPR